MNESSAGYQLSMNYVNSKYTNDVQYLELIFEPLSKVQWLYPFIIFDLTQIAKE